MGITSVGYLMGKESPVLASLGCYWEIGTRLTFFSSFLSFMVAEGSCSYFLPLTDFAFSYVWAL